MASTVFSITIVPYDAEINAHENMLFYSILGIIDVMLKLLIAIVILYRDNEKLVFYAILMAAESFLLRFITQQYCRKHYEECRKVQMCHYYDKATIKEMTSFAGWNMTNTATGMISLFWHEYRNQPLLWNRTKCSTGYCYTAVRSIDGRIYEYDKGCHACIGEV